MITLLPDGYYQPKEWFYSFERVDSSPAKSEFDGKTPDHHLVDSNLIGLQAGDVTT